MPQSDYSEAPAVTIRPMRPQDLVALADLWVVSWREAMPGLDFEARWAWISAVLANPANLILVVETEEVPQGFAVLDGSLLQQLVVAPAAKGRGIAGVLLEAVKAKAPDGLALDVNQGNPRALRFYRREGFRIVGEGRNLGSGLATWHMQWR